jgi:hypothetical protein
MQEDDAVAVLHMDLGAGQEATTFSRAKIESAYPLPACNPGLHIDPEGVVHIYLLLALGSDLRRIALATVTWEPEGSEAQVALGDAVDLKAAPIAAALAYPVQSRAADSPVWVVVLETGELRSSHSSEPHRPAAPPALPLQVLNTGRGSFVLAFEAGGPVRFLSLY